MRLYINVPEAAFGQKAIFTMVLDQINSIAIPRTVEGCAAFLESCYLSNSLFNRLVRTATMMSEKEYIWFPKSDSPMYQMICEEVQLPDGIYRKVSLISESAKNSIFTSVSNIKFFFMDDGEESRYND